MFDLPYNYIRQIMHHCKTLPWFPGSQIRKVLEIQGELRSQKTKEQRLSLGFCLYTKIAEGSKSPCCEGTTWALRRKHSHMNSSCKVGSWNIGDGHGLGKQILQTNPPHPQLVDQKSEFLRRGTMCFHGLPKKLGVSEWQVGPLQHLPRALLVPPRWNATMNPTQALALKELTV